MPCIFSSIKENKFLVAKSAIITLILMMIPVLFPLKASSEPSNIAKSVVKPQVSKPCPQVGINDVEVWPCLRKAFHSALEMCREGRWGNDARLVIQVANISSAQILAKRALSTLKQSVNMSLFSSVSITFIDRQMKIIGYI